MATYKVPKPKSYKEMEKSASVCDSPSRPSIYIPVSKAMLNGVKAGKEVTITLKGTVRATESREGDTYDPKNEIRVELLEVEMPDGDFDELADA